MSFWQSACSMYQKSQVERLLLSLQNERQLVVNHLLFAAWMSEKQLRIDWVKVLSEERRLGLIERLVEPLRQYRVQAKSQVPSNIYNQLKTLELLAERHHIDWLESMSDSILLHCSEDDPSKVLEQNCADYQLANASLDASSEDGALLSDDPLMKGFISAVLG